MKRLLRAIWVVISSRALTPLVIGFFLIIYIGIAFGTDDALIALMNFTRPNVFLVFLLALLPLNSACRLVTETARHLKRRVVLAGNAGDVPPGLFDETVSLPVFPPDAAVLPIPNPRSPIPEVTAPASSATAELESRLVAEGFKTRRTEYVLAAWRGFSTFPARLLYLLGTFCLFAGILISLTTRISDRSAVIEGEPLSAATGGGVVERIVLEQSSGLILARKLSIQVAQSDSGTGRRVFGVYPPSLYQGAFVYPRYLGVALYLRFSAPDLPTGFEKHGILSIYPPGKEDSVEIPGSLYRIVIGMAEPGDGSDPYTTGKISYLFKLLKGNDVLFTGRVPTGGSFARDGYRLEFPDSRRLVITDFIRDYGVLLIWTAAILFMVAGFIWLPVRVFFPRREFLFIHRPDGINACSREEGRGRSHGGVFHEALDLLEARTPDRQPSDGGSPAK